MIIDIRPPGHGKRAPKGAKVIDIVKARQRDEGRKAYFKDWHVDCDKWRMNLCTDGRIYLELIGVGGVKAQIDLDPTTADQLDRDLGEMRLAPRRLHEHRRGAHLWIAWPHPTIPGWLMVKHNDQDTPFKPVKVGARRERTSSSGRKWTPSMPNCYACGKQFATGEHAFEAMGYINGVFGGRARICKGCTQPPREGLVEIEGGKG